MAAHQKKLADLRWEYANKRAAFFRIEVNAERPEGRWVGSGFFISSSGFALTAFHNLPHDVKAHREGYVFGKDFNDKPLQLKFIPMAGDEASDIALLQASDGDSKPYVGLGRMRSDLSDTDRMNIWALRSVVAFGFPEQEGRQVESAIDGHVDRDFPLRSVVQNTREGPTKSDRLFIVTKDTEQLAGISGGPVVDLDSRLVVAVAGARQRDKNLLLASPIRPWAEGGGELDLPSITELPLRTPWARWLIAAAVFVVFAIVFLFSQLSDPPPAMNSVPPAASTALTSKETADADVPPRVTRSEAVSPQTSACVVTVKTPLPYEDFGGPQTCGFEIMGSVTPASRARDVILFVTAGHDAPETRFQGRFTVAAGEQNWRISSCKGTHYSVAVVGPGAMKELDAADVAAVPVVGQTGVACVRTFEGQREP